MDRVILHSDMNNFYASVECFLNPELKNKPVAVCGNPEKRHGIVLAKSLPAKKCGVKTGEPLWQARQKCPDIIFVPPHYDMYIEYSQKAKKIYNRYTNRIEGFGLDECWLDLSDRSFTIKDGKTVADEIRKTIQYELGVTVSIGVSFNKIFAKLGSDLKKPNATTVISIQNFRKKIWHLPANELLYVGRATYKKLLNMNIRTIGDLALTPAEVLLSNFGKVGIMLKKFAQGLDDTPVTMADYRQSVKSVGNGITLPYDLTCDEDVKITLIALSESVSLRLRRHGLCCGGIALALRDNNLNFHEKQCQTLFPICSAAEMYKYAFNLYCRLKSPMRSVRAVTVRAINLLPAKHQQLSFLDEYNSHIKSTSLDAAIDKIREKYGKSVIFRGIMLKNPVISDIKPFEDSPVHPVSFLKEAIDI